jgi:hypothetical protein
VVFEVCKVHRHDKANENPRSLLLAFYLTGIIKFCRGRRGLTLSRRVLKYLQDRSAKIVCISWLFLLVHGAGVDCCIVACKGGRGKPRPIHNARLKLKGFLLVTGGPTGTFQIRTAYVFTRKPLQSGWGEVLWTPGILLTKPCGLLYPSTLLGIFGDRIMSPEQNRSLPGFLGFSIGCPSLLVLQNRRSVFNVGYEGLYQERYLAFIASR